MFIKVDTLFSHLDVFFRNISTHISAEFTDLRKKVEADSVEFDEDDYEYEYVEE